MSILVISDKDFREDKVEGFISKLKSTYDDIKWHHVGNSDLANCVGCSGCWIKTPGECVIKDICVEISKDYINSDVVIIFTPILWGGYSYNIKKFMDRNIGSVLPFFREKHGDTHHELRYEKYPNLIIIGYGNNVTYEEKKTFQELIAANQRNMNDNEGGCLFLNDIEFEALKEITDKLVQEGL